MNSRRLSSSFRDPSGFLFEKEGVLLRQVNEVYRDDYDLLMSSGLYEVLSSEGLLVAHHEVDLEASLEPGAYKVLRPDPVPFVSYPYEWCFSSLKDAALLTLEVQRRALAHGMVLKDASAFNVQFRSSGPVLIDTLSFERYQEGRPWVAYRQFCQHFLSPLILVSRVDTRLTRLLASYLDGIPLDLASRLLPRRSWLRPYSLLHIHLHARAIKRYGDVKIEGSRFDRPMSIKALRGLIESLAEAVRGLRWIPEGTEWADYEADHGYVETALSHKKKLVADLLGPLQPSVVWDLGANTGVFSRIAAESGAWVLAVDSDPAAVERNYTRERKKGGRIMPLLVDLAQPTPDLGWATAERMSLQRRGPADAILALALVHHLGISNNVPFPLMAAWLATLGRHLIIEWVPKSDPQAQRLLLSRQDVFGSYSIPAFEEAFGLHFDIESRDSIPGTQRVIYSMKRRNGSPDPESGPLEHKTP